MMKETNKDPLFEALSAAPEFELSTNFSAKVMHKIAQREREQKWITIAWWVGSLSVLFAASFAGLYFFLGLEILLSMIPYLSWGAIALVLAVLINKFDPKAKPARFLDLEY